MRPLKEFSHQIVNLKCRMSLIFFSSQSDDTNTADVLLLPKDAPISYVLYPQIYPRLNRKSSTIQANRKIYLVVNGKDMSYPPDQGAVSRNDVIFLSI